MRTLEELMAKTKKTSGGCLVYTGRLNRGGYGAVRFGTKNKLAHRMAWLLTMGSEPQKPFELDHICRVRACVNVEHLRVVTRRENVLCGVGLAAQNAKKTHCKNGHPFTGKNVSVSKTRKRVCRLCFRAAAKRHYDKSPSEYMRKQREAKRRRATTVA